jgi:hypothetical protein
MDLMQAGSQDRYDAVVVDQVHLRKCPVSIGCRAALVLEQQAGTSFPTSRLPILVQLRGAWVVVSAEFDIDVEDTSALALDEGARTVVSAFDNDTLAHLLGQAGELPPAAQTRRRARATELEVQHIDARRLAVAAEQNHGAFHIPWPERGLAYVDDINHHHGLLRVKKLKWRR